MWKTTDIWRKMAKPEGEEAGEGPGGGPGCSSGDEAWREGGGQRAQKTPLHFERQEGKMKGPEKQRQAAECWHTPRPCAGDHTSHTAIEIAPTPLYAFPLDISRWNCGFWVGVSCGAGETLHRLCFFRRGRPPGAGPLSRSLGPPCRKKAKRRKRT